MKKIFRNGPFDILVIISFVLTFVVLLNLMPLIQTLKKVENKMNGYDYEEYYQVQFVQYEPDSMTDMDTVPAITYEDFLNFVGEMNQISSGNIYMQASIH